MHDAIALGHAAWYVGGEANEAMPPTDPRWGKDGSAVVPCLAVRAVVRCMVR